MNIKSMLTILSLLWCLYPLALYAQVGINNTNPSISSVLDIKATTQGLLLPRMTSVQRANIASPAEGLLVFDTDINTFYFYNGSSWAALDIFGSGSGTSNTRSNYQLVRSGSDLISELNAGGGYQYLLDTNTLYEINGYVNLAYPINLNNACVTGTDAQEDTIVCSNFLGTVFAGNTGGIINNLALGSGPFSIFNISGTGTENLIVNNCIITGAFGVGTISNLASVLVNNIQFAGNSGGITYTNIDDLFINAAQWDATNFDTYETFTGTFGTITKQNGYSNVSAAGSATAMNITGITSVANASLNGVRFMGGGTYINGSSPYSGYNFTDDWQVNCSGINLETDQSAIGACYYNSPNSHTVTYGNTTNFYPIPSSSINSVASNLFRFSQNAMVLTYQGKTTRRFVIRAKISLATANSSTSATYAFYIDKNATTLSDAVAYHTTDASGVYNQVTVEATVELAEGDTVKINSKRITGSGTTEITINSIRLKAYQP